VRLVRVGKLKKKKFNDLSDCHSIMPYKRSHYDAMLDLGVIIYAAEHSNRVAGHAFTVGDAKVPLRRNAHASTYSC
jgi:hypothetical protein